MGVTEVVPARGCVHRKRVRVMQARGIMIAETDQRVAPSKRYDSMAAMWLSEKIGPVRQISNRRQEEPCEDVPDESQIHQKQRVKPDERFPSISLGR